MGSDRPTKISDPLARGEGSTMPVGGKRAGVSLPRGTQGEGTGISCVRGTDLFRDLSASEIEEIEGMTAMRTSRRGRVFFAPGQTGEVLFILKTGRVNIYRVTPDGKKLVTASLEPGTVFGEMSLIGQGMYDSFAEAAEDCTLCVMGRADVENLLKTKPAVALRAMEIMARRLREAEDRLEGAAFKGVPARLALMPLRLRPGGSGELVGVSHQDLADMVGTYRETVTRVLNDFQAQGLIELGRKRIRVLQPDRVAALAEE
jgi:CRP/FNR family cyclic AMP-dependent transcriptional regulator